MVQTSQSQNTIRRIILPEGSLRKDGEMLSSTGTHPGRKASVGKNANSIIYKSI